MKGRYVGFAVICTLLVFFVRCLNNITVLKEKFLISHSPFKIPDHQTMFSLIMILVLSATLLLSIAPFEAQAAGGAYNLKWYAADPSLNSSPYLPTYAKLTPSQLASPGTAGRYADTLANAVAYGPTGSNLDAVTSISPKDMALGQIVPYEMVIRVDGSTTPENGRISFTTTFDANTTSGDNFGFDPAYMVYAAFVDTADPGNIDPGNNSKVDNYTSTRTGSGSSQKIQGTFNISGLNDGDRVVVEIWVVLKPTVPTKAGGNVQTDLSGARTATGDTISTGAQTVPLLQVGKFTTVDADISVTKTDVSDPVIQGQNLTYSLIVKNNSPDIVANGILVNDTLPSNVTFVSASGAPYTISGNRITFNVGALSPGQASTITIATNVSWTAWANNDTSTNPETGIAGSIPALYDLLNTVSETAVTSDSNTTNNIFYQPTNVLLAKPLCAIEKKVMDAAGRGPTGNITKAGDVISYQINLTNTGNVNLTNVTINDSLIKLTGPIGDTSPLGVMTIGETWIYTGNYTVTQQDINTNGNGTGVIRNVVDLDADPLIPKSHSAEVPIKSNPAYIIEKDIIDVAGKGPEGNVTKVGEVISYRVNVSNVGNVDLTNITLNDSLISLTKTAGDNSPTGILNVGEVWAYEGNYTVTQEDVNTNGGGDGLIENTATVDCDQLDPKSHSAEVSMQARPAYVISKIVTDVSGKGPNSPVTKAGDIISYRINVSNPGNVDLTNVTVIDSLMTLVKVSGDNAPIGILNIGETWTYNGTYSVTQADVNTNGGGDGFIENTATVDCDQLDPKSHSAEVPLQTVPAYTIDKIVTDVAGRGAKSPITKAGDVIRYQIKVANTDSVDLTNITLNDSLISLTKTAGDDSPIGILNVGEVWIYEGNYTVTQQDLNTNGQGKGFIENTATVDCTQLDPKSDSSQVPIIAAPAYTIDKIITDVAERGPESSVTKAGDIITYQVKVTNADSVDLTNVSVIDSLITLTGLTGDNTQPGVLNVGETWTYNGTYSVTQADINSNGNGNGFIENTAKVDCDQLEEKSATAQVQIIGSPVYTVDKSVVDISGNGPSGTITKAEEIIRYSVTVANVGNTDLTNVTVSDSLTSLSDAVESKTPDKILNVGEKWNYTGNYTVTQADINTNAGGDGLIENTATVDCDQLGEKSHSAEVSLKTLPAYIIDKNVIDVGGKGSEGIITKAGENVSYQIKVTNEGNTDLTNVTVNDSIATLTEPEESLHKNGILDVGENWTYNATYSVTQEDINTNGNWDGLIENNASVRCAQLGEKFHTVEVPLKRSPSYSIEKTVVDVAGNVTTGKVTKAADIITYSIIVNNTGNTELTNISVVDSLTNLSKPIESINENGILEVGENWKYNTAYSVTQEDLNNNGNGNGFIENKVNIDCDQLAPVSHSAEVPIIQNPALSIEKSADPLTYSVAGDIVIYTYNVTNAGNVNITKPIEITDDKVGNVIVSGNNLAPGQSVFVNASYIITQQDLDSGSITNTAYATTSRNNDTITSNMGGENDTITSNTDKETVTAVQIPALLIDKLAILSTYDSVGDNITYIYNVTNTGNVNIKGPIVVSDNKIGNINATDGDLVPGESAFVNASHVITQSDLDSGSVTNSAHATGIIGNNTTTSNTHGVTVTAEQHPALLIVKTASPTAYSAVGDAITYTYKVNNSGNVDITGPITILDNKTGTFQIPVAFLEPGNNITGTSTYIIKQADLDNGSVTNSALATGISGNNITTSNSDDETVTGPKKASCEIIKTVTDIAGNGSFANVTKPGEIITYQINVTNTGDVNLTNVSVNDSLINLNLTGPVESVSQNEILEIGETWTYNGTYKVTVKEIYTNGGGTGFIKNTATVDCDQLGPKSDSDQVPIKKNPVEDKPDYVIQKIVIDVAEKGPHAPVTKPGDKITYEIAVANDGNVNLTNVSVKDTLIKDLSGPIESINQDGILEIDEFWIYTGNYTTTEEDVGNKENEDKNKNENVGGDKEGDDGSYNFIENTVTVACDQLDPKSDSAKVPIKEKDHEEDEDHPAYCISKSIIGVDEEGDCIVNEAGDIIKYRIVVKNEGDMDLTDVSVHDDLIELKGPKGDEVEPGVLNVGETWKFYGGYEVTEEDIENDGNGEKEGYIENTATVSCKKLPDKKCTAKQPILQKSDLCIYKSVIGTDENGDCIINEPGDVIQYQIIVKNEGKVDLTGIEVEDSLVELEGPEADDADQGRLDSGRIKPGEVWKYTGEYEVTEEDIEENGNGEENGYIENTATVSCNELPDQKSTAKQQIFLKQNEENEEDNSQDNENNQDDGNQNQDTDQNNGDNQNNNNNQNNNGNNNGGNSGGNNWGSSSGSHSSSSSSKGASGGLTTSPEAAKNIETKESAQAYITNDKNTKFDFVNKNTCVSQITFDAKKTLGKTKATVEMLKGKSSLVSEMPADEVYRYLNIWIGNNGVVNSQSIENAQMSFKVEKQWIKDKNIDPESITLQRYNNGKWEKLQTTKSEEKESQENEKYFGFTAKTPGFSPFAITTKTMEQNTQDEDEKENKNSVNIEPKTKDSGQNKANTNAITKENTEKEQKQTQTKKSPGFEVLTTIAAILAVMCKKRMSEKKK